MEKALKSTSCSYQKIGRITGGKEITYKHDGKKTKLQFSGYSHFKSKRVSSMIEDD